jgi:N-methylhydantoinase B
MDELVVNVMNTPVEAIESEFPVRVERYELARDSGGPGTFRGGLGVRRQWRILADETSVNLRMDRFKFSSLGVFGAKPARPSQAVLNPAGAAERALTSKVAGLQLKRGDLLSVEFAGGGGWGDPLERDVARVRDDVARDYVSPASAREDYGVVLDDDLDVDADATARLRRDKTRR